MGDRAGIGKIEMHSEVPTRAVGVVQTAWVEGVRKGSGWEDRYLCPVPRGFERVELGERRLKEWCGKMRIGRGCAGILLRKMRHAIWTELRLQ